MVKIVTFGLMAGALSVLLISALFTPESLPKIPMCSFRTMTGRPCPGCGLTRSFCCISHGRFGEAFYYNPFGFIFYASALLLVLWPLLGWVFPRLRQWERKTEILNYLVPGIVVIMGIWGVVRMIYGPYV